MRAKRSFALIGLVCLFGLGHAAEVLRGTEAHKDVPGAEVIRYKEFSSIPDYIKFRPTARISESIWKQWMKSRYFKGQTNVDFTLIGTENDRLGMVHYRYRQTLDGTPLGMSTWIVHTMNGEVVSMNGLLFDVSLNAAPSLSSMDALEIALDHVGAETYMWEIPAEEAAIKEIMQDESATYAPDGDLVIMPRDMEQRPIELRLTWMFNIYAHEPMSRREIYIDAEDGTVIFENDLIHHADSNGVAVTGYSGQQEIVSDYTGTQFRLRETGRGNGIFTYDMNNATGGLGSDFFHPDNYWDTTTVERFGTDAHWGAEMTYDFFYDNFNRNSINDNGFALISRVHYGTNYANAFWNGNLMTYGDGSSGNSPFTALDIAGHEIAHGLTNFTANLIYQNESGALNESFSDIFGAAVEFYALGFSAGDWLIGEDLGIIIRSMSNPNAEGDPDTYHGNNWFYGAGDNGGVHTNSGVQNYWFYLLTVGGSGTNDIGDDFDVTGIGVNDAAAIAYRNLVVYLSVYSDYEDARFYALESAMDLYGPCSQQLISTGNAWYAVGVGTPYEDEVTADFIPNSTGNCSVPHTVSFQNTSSNATSQFWFFGDGSSTSALNPSHTYTASGTYTVTLAVSSSCGTDTLVMEDLIEVGPNAPCEIGMPNDGQSSIVTDCRGVLLDNGGATANYSDDNDSYLVISSPGAADITLSFDEFSVEAGGGTNCIYDFLEVYEGQGLSGTLIGRYCNSNQPPSTLTVNGDKLTIRFFSDEGLNRPGFRIAWECGDPTTPPVAQFGVDVRRTCDGKVRFTDLSTNGVSGWLWDFGDGNTSTAQNPVHTYDTSGYYSVSLIASNAIGNDTAYQDTLILVNLATPPSGEDADICPGEQGVLVASSFGIHHWYASAFSNTVLHVGDTFVTPIVQESTPYYVESIVRSSAKGVGPKDGSFGSGGYLASPQSMYFDALSDVVLKSVKVIANTSGDRKIMLLDAQGNLMADTLVNVSTGEQVIELGFEIPQATDYELAISGEHVINLYRNSTGVSYPYELEDVLRITNASNNATNAYYYFYDWQVEEVCVSERAVISASTGICTGIAEFDGSDIEVYPNPANAAVTVRWENEQVTRLELVDLRGSLVTSRQVANRNSSELDVSKLAKGVYILRFLSETGSLNKRLVVQ